jgi:hypothetical protein
MRAAPREICPWRFKPNTRSGGCYFPVGHSGKHRDASGHLWTTSESWNSDGETEWNHTWLDDKLAAELALYTGALV